jgi:DNA replication and repair protein RecF
MILENLGVEDFRCIERAELALHARCNLISGENASGKTTLLEAMFFLGRGRSFRTAQAETLVRSGADGFLLTGRVQTSARSHPLGMRYGSAGIEARYAGRPVSGLAELASVLPAQAIDPEVHRLIEGGPSERRRYLDWGVFHVEPNFIGHWRRYQRALKQRNAALRAEQPEALVRVWDTELVESGEQVAALRQGYVDKLATHVARVGERLLGTPVEIILHRGWAADRPLADSLAMAWLRDRARGMTHSGPHRADLSVRLDGVVARDRVSRGQQKLAASALLLGQLRCDAEAGSEVALLLVDDPAAELDENHLGGLLREVSDVSAQLVVTALNPGNPALASLPSGHRFHVERGQVTRLL